MRRFAPFAQMSAAVLLLSIAGAGTALAEEIQSRNVEPSTEYIKNVRAVDQGDLIRRRRLANTEPRNPDGVVVPEPGTIALVAMGLAGMRLARRKQA